MWDGAHLVHYVNEPLSIVTPSKALDNVGRLHIRDNRVDENGKFIPEHASNHQVSQGQCPGFGNLKCGGTIAGYRRWQITAKVTQSRVERALCGRPATRLVQPPVGLKLDR